MSSTADQMSATQPRTDPTPGVEGRTVRQFVHQLRSHLTAIGPAAEYMAQPDVNDEVRREMSGIVSHCVTHIEGLLADLSVVAAPNQAPSGSAATTVDMTEIARAAVMRHMDYAQSVGAWLAVDAAEGCPPVLGCPQALRQAVGNALLLVLQLARAGDRVLARLRSSGGGPTMRLELRVELHPAEAGQARAAGPVSFTGVVLEAARIIVRQHGGTLGGLTDRPGLLIGLPAAPLQLRPAAAVGGPGAGPFKESPPIMSE